MASLQTSFEHGWNSRSRSALTKGQQMMQPCLYIFMVSSASHRAALCFGIHLSSRVAGHSRFYFHRLIVVRYCMYSQHQRVQTISGSMLPCLTLANGMLLAHSMPSLDCRLWHSGLCKPVCKLHNSSLGHACATVMRGESGGEVEPCQRAPVQRMLRPVTGAAYKQTSCNPCVKCCKNCSTLQMHAFEDFPQIYGRRVCHMLW